MAAKFMFDKSVKKKEPKKDFKGAFELIDT